MLSMMENGNINPLMFSILGKNSGDSALWKEFLELNLLTQGQMGSGNFFTANMLNKDRFYFDALSLAESSSLFLIGGKRHLVSINLKTFQIQGGQTASSLIQELVPVHMAQQMSGKTNDGVIFDSEASPMATMYMGGAFDSLGLNTGLFGKK